MPPSGMAIRLVKVRFQQFKPLSSIDRTECYGMIARS